MDESGETGRVSPYFRLAAVWLPTLVAVEDSKFLKIIKEKFRELRWEFYLDPHELSGRTL